MKRTQCHTIERHVGSDLLYHNKVVLLEERAPLLKEVEVADGGDDNCEV